MEQLPGKFKGAAIFPNVKIMVFLFFIFEVCMYASSKTL